MSRTSVIASRSLGFPCCVELVVEAAAVLLLLMSLKEIAVILMDLVLDVIDEEC